MKMPPPFTQGRLMVDPVYGWLVTLCMAGRPIQNALVRSQYHLGLCPKLKSPRYTGGFLLLPCFRFTVKTKTDRVFGLFRYFCGLLKLREKFPYLFYFSAGECTLGAFALYTCGACVLKE